MTVPSDFEQSDRPLLSVVPDKKDIGSTIRDLRKAKRLSLREVARRTGVSAGHISQLERGLATPSVSLLYKISEVLGTRVDQLFSHDSDENSGSSSPSPTTDPSAPSISVVRQDERRSLRMESGVEWYLLTKNPESNFSFREIVYPPGSTSADNNEFMRHGGREYGLVLEGQLHLQLEFEEFTLNTGDSIAFNSSVPHRFWNPSVDEDVKVVWIHIN